MADYYAYKMKQRRDARLQIKSLKWQLEEIEGELREERKFRKNEQEFFNKLSAEERELTKVYRERLVDEKHSSAEKIRKLKRDVKIFAVAGPLYGMGIYVGATYLLAWAIS